MPDSLAALRPRLVANVSLMLAELPLAERVARVREAGIERVELWWPFSSPAPAPREVAALLGVLDRGGVELAAMNLYGGSTLLGDRGVLCLPGYGEALASSARVALEVARATGCALFNVPYGAPEDDEAVARRRAAQRLAVIAGELDAVGGTALLEPLTADGRPGLHRAADAVALVTELREQHGAPNVAYLLDVHHATNNAEDPAALAREHAAQVGHVQLADVPGRGRPGTGRIDFDAVLAALDATGYRGLVSLEYVTQAPDEESRALAQALSDRDS